MGVGCRHLIWLIATFYTILWCNYSIIIVVTNQIEAGSGQHVCSITYGSQCPQLSYDVHIFTKLPLDVDGSSEALVHGARGHAV